MMKMVENDSGLADAAKPYSNLTPPLEAKKLRLNGK
jgi:hypothetical protein